VEERGLVRQQQQSEQQRDKPSRDKEISRQAARVGRTTYFWQLVVCLGIRA